MAASAAGCSRSRPAVPVLESLAPCDAEALGEIPPPAGVSFRCGTLNVPLDHGLLPGPRNNDDLDLDVAVADNPSAPRGVLVWLVGGPGSPGVRLAGEIASQFDPAVMRDYRLVMFSSRGTGSNALDCGDLQAEMGGSDLAVPSAEAVRDCAEGIGPERRFHSTLDTVADLDDLRQALGAPKLTLAGASYGTLVAARYAITHPDRVERLVLDSVVPHDGVDPLNIAVFNRAAEVLRAVCAPAGCATDPAQDLADQIRARRNGPALLDLLSDRTHGKPELADLPAALRDANRGNPGALDAMLAGLRKGSPPPEEEFSAGLHTATGCQDMSAPWPGPNAPVAGREQAARAALAALPDRVFFPFDRDAALGNGALVSCLYWPETPTPPFPTGRDLPPVPTLLLAGELDLVTPLGWTQAEAARAPKGRLVLVPGAGHITQDRANGTVGRDAVTAFLTAPTP